MIAFVKIICVGLVVSAFVSCDSLSDKRLETALTFSGQNRVELEKVLKHYKDEPQKLQAARFLIENMPGHTGYDSTVVTDLQPVYDEHAAISSKYDWKFSKAWWKEISSLGKRFASKQNKHSYTLRQDAKVIKGDWLILQIDLAFKAWQENVYTRNASFETFCRYILPYRVKNELCLDNSRTMFYARHAGCFADSTVDFRDAADSLLYQYRYLKHSDFVATNIPLYDAPSFEKIKRGLCDAKVWYNSILLSSLGMAVTSDFIPAWGNRSGAHGWSALLIDGKTYPFEPFWDVDRWKYKIIYNNKGFDLKWGEFRLPKVFRTTYDYHIEGPLKDRRVDREDIPALFRNPQMEDVSSEYFEATNITRQLQEPVPEDTYYCYLCVFGTTTLQPVQWGKIEKNGTVLFKGMGRDMIYFPAYCKDGNLIPAGNPFILEQDGACRELKCGTNKIPVTIRTTTSYLYPSDITEGKRTLVGSYLTGSNTPEPTALQDTLYCFTDSMDMWYNDEPVSVKGACRYIRLYPPTESFKLCDITFYERNNKELSPIVGVKVRADMKGLKPGEEISMMADHLSGTGFKGVFNGKYGKQNGIVFDLGKPHKVESISYVPYTESFLADTLIHKMYYWDKKKWIKAGERLGNDQFITFDNLPEGTIYRLVRPNSNERIFTYEDGMVNWF